MRRNTENIVGSHRQVFASYCTHILEGRGVPHAPQVDPRQVVLAPGLELLLVNVHVVQVPAYSNQ
jgi:hypothetical protein